MGYTDQQVACYKITCIKLKTAETQHIRQWEYHKGASAEASWVTTWEIIKNIAGCKMQTTTKPKMVSFTFGLPVSK